MSQIELENTHIDLRSRKRWGSYGKDGVNDIPEFYFIKDLGDSHIINILKTQDRLSIDYKRIFVNELIFRMNYNQYRKEETSNPCSLNL